jgi:hypothetical protein
MPTDVTPAMSITPLHIRRSVPFNALFGVVFVAGALFFGWAIAARLMSGRAVDGMSWMWLLMMAAMSFWTLRDALDRRVQVTLTAEGFSDRRAGGALTPWSAVREANGIVAAGVSIVEFTIGEEDARDVGKDWLEGSGRHREFMSSRHVVRIVMRNLDASSADVLAFVRRAAPHVVIPKAFDLLHGWREQAGDG